MGRLNFSPPAQTPGRRATKVSAGGMGGATTICTPLPTIPLAMWIARFTIARWRPGPAGLITHCDRLTPRKRDRAPDLWPHPCAREGLCRSPGSVQRPPDLPKWELKRTRTRWTGTGGKTDDSPASATRPAAPPGSSAARARLAWRPQAQARPPREGTCGDAGGPVHGPEHTDSHPHPEGRCSLASQRGGRAPGCSPPAGSPRQSDPPPPPSPASLPAG